MVHHRHDMSVLNKLAWFFINSLSLIDLHNSLSVHETYQYEFFPGLLPYHQTGSLFNTTAWQVTVDDESNAFLTFGPYTNISKITNQCGVNIDISTLIKYLFILML